MRKNKNDCFYNKLKSLTYLQRKRLVELFNSANLNNNCTLCKHYHFQYVNKKHKKETNHYCSNFIKLEDSIEYNCEKFQPNERN